MYPTFLIKIGLDVLRFQDRTMKDRFPGACIDRQIGNDLCVRQNYSGYQLNFLRYMRPTAALFELQFKETPNQFLSRSNAMSELIFAMLCTDIPFSAAGVPCAEHYLEVRTLWLFSSINLFTVS